MLEKPKLFLNVKEFLVTLFILSFLLLIRLLYIYSDYEAFKSKPFYYTEVEVIQAYEKRSSDGYYTILKLYSSTLDMTFFSRTKKDELELSRKLRVKIFPNSNMEFLEYLAVPFIYSKVNRVYRDENSSRNRVVVAVEAQHSEAFISNFYNAIFFATPLEKDLRKRVSALGVSHLIALSGFHLAILWGVLFSLLKIIYRPIQQKFFPYRFDLFDVGFIVLLLLAFYVWFVGAPPSLIRSYTMLLLSWILLVLGMELLSFSFLGITVSLLLLIFPKMLLSLAFWFSVIGVFYIFLLLHYFSTLNRYLMTLLISFGIFILMLPIVHMIFPVTSLFQLASPLLSLIFSIFYPLSIFLHLVGLGYLFDPLLLSLFTLESREVLVQVNIWLGVSYMTLSILSIYSRWLFYVLSLYALSFSIWLFSSFWVS